jgi:hypothetical protein
MLKPNQKRLGVLSAPEEMIGKRRAVLGKLTLTPLVRLSPRKCRPAAWMAPRLIHLRLYNKISRSLQLTLDLRFALFFALFVSPEGLRVNRRIGFISRSLTRIRYPFARNDHLYGRSRRAPAARPLLQTRVLSAESSLITKRLYPNDTESQKASVTAAFWKSSSSRNDLLAHRNYFGASGINVAAAWRGVQTIRTRVKYGVVNTARTPGDSRRAKGEQPVQRWQHLPALYQSSASWAFALGPSLRGWRGSVVVSAHWPFGGSIASTAHALASRLVVEYGSSRPSELWTQKLRRAENPAAVARSQGSTSGNILSAPESLLRRLFAIRPGSLRSRGSPEVPVGSPVGADFASGAYLSISRLLVRKDNVRNPASVGGDTLPARIGLFSRSLVELLPTAAGWRGFLKLLARLTRALVATSRVQLLASAVVDSGDIRVPAFLGGNTLFPGGAFFYRSMPGTRGRRGSSEISARSTAESAAAWRRQLLASRAINSGNLRTLGSVGGTTLSSRSRLFSPWLYGPLSSPRDERETFAVPARPTTRAIRSSTAHAPDSAFPYEHGHPSRSEDRERKYPEPEDGHVAARSSVFSGGKMREDLSAGLSRKSSHPVIGKASQPGSPIRDKLFHRTLFSVALGLPTTQALLTPIVSGHSRFTSLPQSVGARALPGGDVASVGLVHVHRRAKSVATAANGKSVETTGEQSRYHSIVPAGLAARNRGALRELVASRRDMQVLSQCVYEIIVDRVRREKERIGH